MSRPPLSAELQQQLRDAIERRYRQAERHLGRRFARPEVRCDIRGQSAGMAYPQSNRLRFNPFFLAQEPAPFLREVVPHEIAHLLAYQLFGKVRPHGREWQHLMRELFEVPPMRTHNFAVDALPSRRHAYRCACSEHRLSTVRHHRIERGTTYLCRRCKTALVLA